MKVRLLQTVHVLAICGAIAFMAWTKSHPREAHYWKNRIAIFEKDQ
jgi:hypothetical protein